MDFEVFLSTFNENLSIVIGVTGFFLLVIIGYFADKKSKKNIVQEKQAITVSNIDATPIVIEPVLDIDIAPTPIMPKEIATLEAKNITNIEPEVKESIIAPIVEPKDLPNLESPVITNIEDIKPTINLNEIKGIEENINKEEPKDLYNTMNLAEDIKKTATDIENVVSQKTQYTDEEKFSDFF